MKIQHQREEKKSVEGGLDPRVSDVGGGRALLDGGFDPRKLRVGDNTLVAEQFLVSIAYYVGSRFSGIAEHREHILPIFFALGYLPPLLGKLVLQTGILFLETLFRPLSLTLLRALQPLMHLITDTGELRRRVANRGRVRAARVRD